MSRLSISHARVASHGRRGHVVVAPGRVCGDSVCVVCYGILCAAGDSRLSRETRTNLIAARLHYLLTQNKCLVATVRLNGLIQSAVAHFTGRRVHGRRGVHRHKAKPIAHTSRTHDTSALGSSTLTQCEISMRKQLCRTRR